MTMTIHNAISCNMLDRHFFDELRLTSLLLSRYDMTLVSLTPGFSSLLSDLFFLLYKIEPILLPQTNAGRPVLQSLMESYTLKKLRGRTAGSRIESYLALKVLLDELLSRLRGSEIPAKLEDLATQLSPLYETKKILEERLAELPETFPNLSDSDARHLESLKKPFGLSEKSTLDEIALALAEALNKFSTSRSKESDYINAEKSEKRTSQNAPSDDQPPVNDGLDQVLESALSPELSEFLEKLDQSLNKDHEASETERATGADTSEDSSKSGPKSGPGPEMDNDKSGPGPDFNLQGIAEGLAETLSAIAANLKAQMDGSQPESMAPAGFSLSATEEQQMDQWRVVEGAGQGVPVASTILGFDGSTQSGGSFRLPASSLLASIMRLNERISRLEGRLADVLRPLDFNASMNKSIEAVDQFGENMKALGVNTEIEDSENFDHVLELYKSLKEPSAIRFLNKVGKKREIARRAQYRKKRKIQYMIDKVGTGERLDGLIDEEIMNLSMDVFSNNFYDRFLNQSLLVYEMEGRVARDRGPIVLCYDGSGSMEGIKIEETKALLVSFIEVARIQKRRLITLQFASKMEPLFVQEFNPHRVGLEEIMRLLGHFIRGGTDFETPLRAAVEILKDDHYRHADILMITDGFSDIREAFKKEFCRYKAEMAFKLYAIIIHGETYGDYGDLGEISDEILEIRDRDLSDWNEKISAQLFEMI